LNHIYISQIVIIFFHISVGGVNQPNM